MYFSRGLADPLSTAVTLASTVGKAHDQETVRQNLYRFLQNQRPRDDAFVAKPVLVKSSERMGHLAKRFGLTGAGLEVPPVMSSAQQNLDAALDLLPLAYRQLIDLCVFEIVLYSAPLPPGSGALLDQPGTLYVSVSEDWDARDIAECLVHETTHILLWLDEYRYGHHPDPWETGSIDKFGLTSITGSMKSATVVFHSYITAAEVAGLRRFGIERGVSWDDRAHGPTSLLLERTTAAYDALIGRPDLHEHFTPRALELVDAARRSIHREFPSVEATGSLSA